MVLQPDFGLQVQAARSQADDGGKKLSRAQFGQVVGLSMARVRSIELGKELKEGELEKLVAAFPSLSDVSPGDVPSDSTPPATPSAEPQGIHEEPRPPYPAEQAEEAEAGPVIALGEDDLDDEDSWLGSDPSEIAVISAQPQTEPGRRLLPLVARNIQISNSETQTFKRCRRKWWLRWYRGLELQIRDPAGALSTGDRVHRALQAWYVPEGQDPVDPRYALELAIEQDWGTYTEACGGSSREPNRDALERFAKAAQLERAMVSGYMEWLSETGVDSGLRVIAPETALTAPLTISDQDGNAGAEVDLIGKLDVRAYREVDGVRLFIDHKTTSSLTRPLQTIRMNEQMLHYHLLEWLADVSGERCDGALYNMLRKVGRSERAKPPFYDRVEVRHNHHELAAFRLRLMGVIRDIISVRAALGAGGDPLEVAYPTPNDTCSWSCEFLHVCTMFDDGSRAEDLIAKQYHAGDPNSRYQKATNEE